MPRNSTRTLRSCEICGAQFPFLACPSNIRLGRGRFCSKDCQKRWQTVPLPDRFRRYLGPITATGCIPWTGATNADGYGVIGSGTQNGHNILAHRLSYELAHGPIAEDTLVLHSCDNPACVNDAHLFLGTQADNAADMVAKGRALDGERAHSAKLSEGEVLVIRDRYAAGGISQARLGKEFGVVQTVIGRIVRRETWKHIPDEVNS